MNIRETEQGTDKIFPKILWKGDISESQLRIVNGLESNRAIDSNVESKLKDK